MLVITISMKNRLLLLVLLTVSSQIKSHPFENLIEKFILFYTCQFTATLSHELGHALISRCRNFNPKIIIGAVAKNDDKLDHAQDPFIQIDSSYDPTCGSTRSIGKKDCKEDRETKLNRNIIQSIMGPTFGILARFVQLLIINRVKYKLGSKLSNSLRDFISAHLVAEFIYGFTPFNQYANGDGIKLFNMLHIKYKLKTTFFSQAKLYQQSFSNVRNNVLQLVIAYYLIYFLLKLIKKNEILEAFDEKFNNKFIHSFCGYVKSTKSYFLLDDTKSFIEEVYKKHRNEDKRIDNVWVSQLVSECFLF
jgi:hypothetical protein